MQRNAVYIVSVNKERSVRNIVYAQDKVNQRCLSRTGLSHYADVFAGFDRERNIPKHIEFTVRIAKIQVPHFNFALHRTDINRARSITNVYFGIEQLSYTVERGFAARSFSISIETAMIGQTMELKYPMYSTSCPASNFF